MNYRSPCLQCRPSSWQNCACAVTQTFMTPKYQFLDAPWSLGRKSVFCTFFIFYTESVMLSPRFILKSLFYTQSAMRTVPLKCKLTVSTRNSILDPRSFRESSFEARVSSFDFRGSRTKFRGSSFKFRDNQRIFRGSWTEISRKRLNSRKQNNSDEQSNWRATLFAQINPLLNVCKYFFVLCIFYKTHAVRLSTLKLMTAN